MTKINFTAIITWLIITILSIWIFVMVVSLFTGCRKQEDCPTWTADLYYVAKVSGINTPPPSTITFTDCTQYTHGQVILYHENANMKYYKRIR